RSCVADGGAWHGGRPRNAALRQRGFGRRLARGAVAPTHRTGAGKLVSRLHGGPWEAAQDRSVPGLVARRNPCGWQSGEAALQEGQELVFLTCCTNISFVRHVLPVSV